MSHRSVLLAACSLVVLVGCGSSEPEQPAAQAGTPNKQTASQTSTSTITSMQTVNKQGATGADGQSSAQSLQSVAAAMQNLVTPQSGNTGAAQQGLTLFPTETGTTGTCTCTATSCTFEACGNGTSFKMDGTYSWGGGTIKAALKYTVNSASGGAAADIVMELAADIKITETTLDGTVSSKGTSKSTFGAYSATTTWDSTMTYAGVTFAKGGGSPTAGSAKVKATTTTAGIAGAGGATYAADFDITFPFK